MSLLPNGSFFYCHEHLTGSKAQGNFCFCLLEKHIKYMIKLKK